MQITFHNELGNERHRTVVLHPEKIAIAGACLLEIRGFERILLAVWCEDLAWKLKDGSMWAGFSIVCDRFHEDSD